MTDIHPTPRAIEQRIADALDALLQRDRRIADTILRVTRDRALTREIEQDMQAVQAELFDALIAVRELRSRS